MYIITTVNTKTMSKTSSNNKLWLKIPMFEFNSKLKLPSFC